MSQESFSPKIRFLDQKVCSDTRSQTDMKVKTEDILSGFKDFIQIFLQSIIKEQSKKEKKHWFNGVTLQDSHVNCWANLFED